MKCEICGKTFVRLKAHLKTKTGVLTHGISLKDYYDLYIAHSNGQHRCEICGKATPFNEETFSYDKCCSMACRYKLRQKHLQENLKEKYGCTNVFQRDDVMEKIKSAMYENYGVANALQSDGIKEKVKRTNLEKYGAEWHVASNETKEKIKETCIKKYDSPSVLCNAEFREKAKKTKLAKYGDANYNNLAKAKKTRLERYGDENYSNFEKGIQTKLERYGTLKNASNLDKTVKTFNAKYGKDYYTQTDEYKAKRKDRAKTEFMKLCEANDLRVESFDDYGATFHCDKCKKDFFITRQLLSKRLKYHNEICTNCNSLYNFAFSDAENDVYEYVKQMCGHNVLKNDRTVLTGKELDIYIPDLKIGIEYDGVHWHDEMHKPNDYHLRKTEECEKQGIQLIHIFEDEWKYKTEIVKSRLSGIFGFNKRIFARKCECKTISYDESRRFLDENHIQGNCVSKYRYGLFYNGELASVMTFGKSRFKNEFEMLRFCNRLYINVIGGAGKLFKHFLNDHPEIAEIVSFADRRWSQGDLYEKLNFSKVLTTPPNYYYIVGDERRNRIEFQKHKLVKEGYDKNKSEHEIMLEREIYRIYDCGNLKYEFVRK